MSAKISVSNRSARENMVSALMKLLEMKPLSDISVSEITNTAGVSRMTYYRNYQSKEEIFSSHLKDIFLIYQKELHECVLCDQKDTEEDFVNYQHLLHCFRYFKKHESFMRILLISGMGDMLLRALTEYMLTAYYHPERGTSYYYQLQAYAGSLYNTFMAWLQKGTEESAEHIAGYLYEIYQ